MVSSVFLPSVVTVLNFSGVWRLFVAGFGLVLVANSFGARCDLGREIIYRVVATASLSFCFRLEACQPATPCFQPPAGWTLKYQTSLFVNFEIGAGISGSCLVNSSKCERRGLSAGV